MFFTLKILISTIDFGTIEDKRLKYNWTQFSAIFK